MYELRISALRTNVMDDLQPILAVIPVLGLLGGVCLFLRRRGIASLDGPGIERTAEDKGR